ncbi:MAG: 2Fe-2S iron-sulfur cluster binding domain-containing protein, partial [Bacteroidales bacterium]|nr:2Fe-2S iron-sulfur cluster binding domain-containing protein [Bacteroidales bacterium]
MITFILNGNKKHFDGSPEIKLIDYLRLFGKIISVKDGCSGQGVCGACTVEINGKPGLACTTRMKQVQDAEIVTMEGLPANIREILIRSFSEKGAVQCGYCSPGMIMRVANIFRSGKRLTREEIFRTISPNLCRCTGYIKIVDAIEAAFKVLNFEEIPKTTSNAQIGERYPKYESLETAFGKRPFVNDIYIDGLVHGALKFSDFPRAKILNIDFSQAKQSEGIIGIFTAKDIPGDPVSGLIFKDWPLMIDIGQRTNCISDVLVLVIAETEDQAREAADKIIVEYDEEA